MSDSQPQGNDTQMADPLESNAKTQPESNQSDTQDEVGYSGTMYDSLLADNSIPNTSIPPAMRQLDKKDQSQDQPEKKYKIHIKLRKTFDKKAGNEIHIVDQFKCILSRIMVEVPNLLLQPFDEKSTENHILQGIDVPEKEDLFNEYVKGARITNANSLVLNFKIISPIPFWKLKTLPRISKYLNDNKVYILQQTLDTYETVKVGGFIFAHNQYTRRDEMVDELNKRINEGHEEKLFIQIAPYTYTLRNGNEKVVTRTISVECDKECADEVKCRMMEKFAGADGNWKYENSAHFRFFPFRPSQDVPVSAIKQFVQAQNVFLHTTSEITIYNMKNSEWILPKKNITFKKLLLQTKHPVNKEPLVYAVERGNIPDKFLVVVKQKYVQYVKNWLKKIADEIDDNTCTVAWANLTGSEGKFRLTYRASNSSHSSYSSKLLNELNPQSGENNLSATSPPPSKKRVIKKVITFDKAPEQAWGSKSGSISSMSNNEYNVSKLTPKKNKPTSANRNSENGHKVQDLEKKVNSFEAQLLERISIMNSKLEANIASISNSSNTTNLLVKKMLDNNDIMMEGIRPQNKPGAQNQDQSVLCQTMNTMSQNSHQKKINPHLQTETLKMDTKSKTSKKK